MPKQKKYKRKYKDAKGKTRYEYAKKDRGYLGALVKVAPIFAAKALLGDLPKGAIEQATEAKLKGGKGSFGKYFKQGLKGRGAGRALGAGLGIASAPVFLKGIDLATSSNKKERKKGLLYLGLSAAMYQLPKGGIEGYRASKSLGESTLKALKKGGVLGTTRSLYKTPAALLMGYGLAAGRRKGKKGEEPTLAKKMLLPALGGGALGALSRAGEDVVSQMTVGKEKNLVRALRKALPAAGGGAVGGLLGGLVLSSVIEGASKALKKEASLLPEVIALGLGHSGTAGAMRYGKPGRFAARLGLSKPQRYFSDKQSTQMALGIREGIAGRVNPGARGSMSVYGTIPELAMSRELGITIGKILRKFPDASREQLLLKAKRYVNAHPELKVHPRTGEPTPFLHNLDEAIDKAIGGKPLWKKSKHFPTFQKGVQKLLYSGRGSLGEGLPKAGPQDAKSALSKVIPGLGLLGLGLSGAAGPIGGHFLVGGGKAVLPNIPGVGSLFKGRVAAEVKKGGLRGLFPGMRESKVDKRINDALFYGLSPASGDLGRLAEAVTSHAKKRYLVPKSEKLLEALSRKTLIPKKKRLRDVVPKYLAGGVGAGALLGGLKKVKDKRRQNEQ